MEIERQLEIKREVIAFYLKKFPDFKNIGKGTFSLQQVVDTDLSMELYMHLDNKAMLPTGMSFQEFMNMIINKMNFAISVAQMNKMMENMERRQ